jgi:SAM-dependent methyltransferase
MPQHPQDEISQNVLSFYKELPFNARDSVSAAAEHVRMHDPVGSYPPLRGRVKRKRILEVGCGVGWFSNGLAFHHNARVTGIDFNPVAIERAEATARALKLTSRFSVQNLFEYSPPERFSLVVSLGVLHHTSDCEGAVRRICKHFLDERGTVVIGLYHTFGRKPFLEHFRTLQKSGASEDELLKEYGRLHNLSDDATHLRSWFRDQVLHPHETQHTYAELRSIIESEGLRISSTSLNRFNPITSHEEIEIQELQCKQVSLNAISEGRYYPGFFVVVAER